MKGKKVLIVEDDKDFRDVLELILMQEGINLTLAANGKEALEALNQVDFDLIISDFQMPIMNGKELFLAFRELNKPGVFVLMTGFGEISNEKQALEMGMDGFLGKPFRMDDIIKLVANVLSDKDSQTDISLYNCIPISMLVCDEVVPYSIYLLLHEQKFVKILNSGEKLDSKRAKSYLAKGVNEFYIKRTDFNTFADYHLAKFGERKSTGETIGKAELIEAMTEVIFDKVYVEGLNSELFHQTSVCMKHAIESLAQSKKALTLLGKYKQQSESLFRHSIAVAVYSVMLAREVGHTSEKALQDLAIAGIFHDIGKSKIDIEDLEVPKELRGITSKDADNHSHRSVRMLGAVHEVNSDIIKMVLHHEDCRATSAYIEGKLVSRAHILAVANKFCNLLIAYKDKNIFNIINSMKATESYIPGEVIIGLRTIFKNSQVA